MCTKKVWLIGVVLSVAVFGTCWAPTLEHDAAPSRYRLAELQDLTLYPDSLPDNETDHGQLFIVRLPMGDLAVILRPITESEYGAFQVQAIGDEIIERQMLAAAIVLPRAAEQDVAGFSLELVGFLRQQVNAISGFEVFDVINFPVSP